MSATTVGLIVIPVVLFLLGAAYGAIKGAIRFAQYLVRSEEASERSATSLANIDSRLGEYMKQNDARLKSLDDRVDGELRNLDGRLQVVEFAVDVKRPPSNGKP